MNLIKCQLQAGDLFENTGKYFGDSEPTTILVDLARESAGRLSSILAGWKGDIKVYL